MEKSVRKRTGTRVVKRNRRRKTSNITWINIAYIVVFALIIFAMGRFI